MALRGAAKDAWRRVKHRVAGYLANDDRLVEASNSAALLVWSSQPLYPVYVWLLVGSAAWPALLTWLSTPFFVMVPIVARRSSVGGRSLFVGAGIGNTLLSTKAFGAATAVGWFLIPCFVIAAAFFRRSEWRVAGALSLATAAAGVAIPRLGSPLHAYSAIEARSLSHLNLWSVVVLSVYLLVAAVRARK